MYTRSAERSSASLKGTAEPLCLGGNPNLTYVLPWFGA